MRKIIAIHSVEGSFFSIGKDKNGYYLRNDDTVIPNEFNRYSMEKIREMFENLCKMVSDCEEVDRVKYDQHKNSFIRVTYDDMSEHLFKGKGDGRHLCGYTCAVAWYNEFYDETFMSIRPEILNIDRIRLVCREGREDLEVLCDAIDDMDGDDYQFFRIEPRNDGGYDIARICYGIRNDCISISKDGRIERTGGFTYVDILKEHDVRVFKRNE